MFTGCITHTGKIYKRKDTQKGATLFIVSELAEELHCGDSVAVNGACLTVESLEKKENLISFHTLKETLKRTNIGLLSPGSMVNLEYPLRMGDPLHGHWVSGHIDTTTSIIALESFGDDYIFTLQLPPISDMIVEKGSIAVDGISLTVASVTENAFTVHIIPYTFQNTRLSEIKKGDRVNLETDILGKYVLKGLQSFLNQQILPKK